MRRRRQKLEVSTFPFLAVLLCAMGSLILVLLVMDRKSRQAASLRVREETRRRADEMYLRRAASTAEVLRRQQEARAAWEEARRLLRARLDKEQHQLTEQVQAVQSTDKETATKADDEVLQLALLRRELEAEKARLLGEQHSLAAKKQEWLQSQSQADQKKHTILSQMSAELVLLEQTLKDLQSARVRDSHTYSVIPYKGKSGESRRPIYIECANNVVVFHPERRVLWPEQQATEVRAEVQQRILRQREQWAALKVNAGEIPYLMLLVRPDGVGSYYRLQTALKGLEIQFGYELIDPDWVLNFPAEDQAPEQRWMVSTPSDPGAPIAKRDGPRAVGIPRSPNPLLAAAPSSIAVSSGAPPANSAGTGASSGLPGWGGNGGNSPVKNQGTPAGPYAMRGTGPYLPGNGTDTPGSGLPTLLPGGTGNTGGGAGGPSGKAQGTSAGPYAMRGTGPYLPGNGTGTPGNGLPTLLAPGGTGTAAGINAVGGGNGWGGSGNSTVPAQAQSGTTGPGTGWNSAGPSGLNLAGQGGTGTGLPGGGTGISTPGNQTPSNGSATGIAGFGTPGVRGAPARSTDLLASNSTTPNSAGYQAGQGSSWNGPGAQVANGAPQGGNGIGTGQSWNGTNSTGTGNGSPGAGTNSTGTGVGSPGSGMGSTTGGVGVPGMIAPPGQTGQPGQLIAFSSTGSGNGSPNPDGSLPSQSGGANLKGAPTGYSQASHAGMSGPTAAGASSQNTGGGVPRPPGDLGLPGSFANGPLQGTGSGGTGSSMPSGPGGTSGQGPGTGGSSSTGDFNGSGSGSSDRQPGTPASNGAASSGGPSGASPGASGASGSPTGQGAPPQSGSPGGSPGGQANVPEPAGGSPTPNFGPRDPNSMGGGLAGGSSDSLRGPEVAADPGLPTRTSRIAPTAVPVSVPSTSPPRRPLVMRPARISGDRDWVIFVECRENDLVLYPSRQVIPLSALTRDPASNPLLQMIRQMIARRQASVRPGDMPYRPQVRFLLRPENERTFHVVYPTMEPLGVPINRQALLPEDDVPSIVAEG